jgi:hypothetical protein
MLCCDLSPRLLSSRQPRTRATCRVRVQRVRVQRRHDEGRVSERERGGDGVSAERSTRTRRRSGNSCNRPCERAPSRAVFRHLELSSAIFGALTAGAVSPTDNPPVCPNEIDRSDCLNGCPSLWYSVIGTGLSMTASSCAPGTFADFDQRIIVWGGTSCSDKTCVGCWCVNEAIMHWI